VRARLATEGRSLAWSAVTVCPVGDAAATCSGVAGHWLDGCCRPGFCAALSSRMCCTLHMESGFESFSSPDVIGDMASIKGGPMAAHSPRIIDKDDGGIHPVIQWRPRCWTTFDQVCTLTYADLGGPGTGAEEEGERKGGGRKTEAKQACPPKIRNTIFKAST
jgi:hypothetical protein